MFQQFSKLFRRPARRPDTPANPKVVLAQQLFQSGQLQQAEQACRKILAANPREAEAYNLLGGIAVRAGNADRAVDLFSKAIGIDSGQAAFHQGLAFAYFNLRKYNEAIGSFKKAVALAPKNPATHNNLGNIYQDRHDYAEAARCYKKAISLDPNYVTGYLNLADTLTKQKKCEAAVETYQQLLRIADDTPENRPTLVRANHRLGLAHRQLKNIDAAIAAYRQAIALDPNFAEAHNSLGGVLLRRNDMDGAIECFRRALAIDPSIASLHSNLLLAMNYVSSSTQQQIYRESLKFDTQHARRLAKGKSRFGNSKNPDKVLRIGYLSPDFKDHSVAQFTRNLVHHHNRRNVEVYCYAHVESPDHVTRQFQSQADAWRTVYDLADEEIAKMIREDGIDILIDLSGHTASNRLLVMARRPAPVQATWLGYPNTSGMRAIDYRLTDAVADPVGEADRLHSETLIRLDHGFLCYQPEEPLPDVTPPPCLTKGYVTFGSFNVIMKTTPDVIGTWSEILASVPDSRLVLKSEALNVETINRNLLQAFADRGISADRVDLIAWVKDRDEHLQLYSGIDVALDPFPYNGTTTTCEALWMGVPVVCLRGDRHSGRVGASILHFAGIPDLVADSEQDYVALAGALAADPENLRARRQGQRETVRGSDLMNLEQFTATLEKAYREMWKKYCDNKR